MEIVPQDSQLTEEARIAPQDIDQVAIGQSANRLIASFTQLYTAFTAINADIANLNL